MESWKESFASFANVISFRKEKDDAGPQKISLQHDTFTHSLILLYIYTLGGNLYYGWFLINQKQNNMHTYFIIIIPYINYYYINRNQTNPCQYIYIYNRFYN